MENIAALIEQCGLGTITGEISPVSGGLMHKVYKIQTTTGTYAVKCLNPEIMSRPDAMKNYAEAERLERILEDNGIPVVAAISFDGKKMLSVNGRYYYIFPWIEGKITDFDNISSAQCLKAGEILGRIHGIDARKVESEDVDSEKGLSKSEGPENVLSKSEDPENAKSEYAERGNVGLEIIEKPDLSSVDFYKYLRIAKDKNSKIALLLEENISLLENAQNKLNEARKNLPLMRAISNDDMDPKNIMWHESDAYVIDLECLGYSNPISSSLDLALQWAGTVNGKFCRDNLEAFFQGYLKSYDNGFRSYDRLFGIAYTWIEWLDYNIKRALGLVSLDAEEIGLGEAETVNTINRIKYLATIEDEICQVLRNVGK